jgi:hypothetical protein
MRTKSTYEGKWDAIGIGASLACAIHCVLLPVLFTTLTLFGIEILENPLLEVLTILVSMGAGGWAIWRGYIRLHRKKPVLVYFITGLVLMIAGNFFHHMYPEMCLKITGAGLIISAHIMNWKASRHRHD